MSQDITFRRIRGRIVPIKLKKDDKRRIKEASKGIGIAAVGTALATASGDLYRKAVIKSSSSAMEAFSKIEESFEKAKKAKNAQQTLFDYAQRTQKQNEQFEKLRKSKNIGSLSKVIRAAAVPVGAGLIGYGAFTTLSAIPKEKRKNMDPALIAGGTAAAGVIAPRAYRYANEAFTAGMGGKQGVMNFGKAKFKSVAPKFKQALSHIFKAKF